MTDKTIKLQAREDDLTVDVLDPYSAKRSMKLRIQGDVVDSGDYTNAIHAHIESLVKRLDQAGVHIWEFHVEKLIPRPEMCESCGRKKGDVKDLAIAFRVENGISGGGAWEIMIEELGWMPIGVWRDSKHPKDVWLYLKRVIA